MLNYSGTYSFTALVVASTSPSPSGAAPMTVVLDEDGIIVARFDGSVDYETLKAAIEDALN